MTARRAGWLVALLVLVGAIVALREATLSTHEAVPFDSTLVLTLRGSTRNGERTQSLAEMTSAALLTCRLEVNADPTGPVEQVDGDTFRVVLRPSLDRTDRRQLRGCLEDWRIDHLRLAVESMDEE